MDLLATVRKEGSRGGTGDFKWSDVQSSSHREHYLGHSLMAPVGRWQKGRDLNWYVKNESSPADGEDPAVAAARERKEEIRRVKEAEEDALARALGLPVPDRSNANLVALGNSGGKNEVSDETKGIEEGESAKGLGYGAPKSRTDRQSRRPEDSRGSKQIQDNEMQYALKEYKRRHGDKRPKTRERSRSRSRSKSQDRDKKYRRRSHHHDRDRGDRHRRLSQNREQYSRNNASRSPDKNRKYREMRRARSRSPYRDEEYRSERYRRRD